MSGCLVLRHNITIAVLYAVLYVFEYLIIFPSEHTFHEKKASPNNYKLWNICILLAQIYRPYT